METDENQCQLSFISFHSISFFIFSFFFFVALSERFSTVISIEHMCVAACFICCRCFVYWLVKC